jgi:hypothetical protein
MALGRELLLFTLGEIPKKKQESVGKQYAKALGQEPEEGKELLKDLVS